MKMHKFLIDKNGDLTKAAQSLPKVRDYLDRIPVTKATFKLSDIDIEVNRSRMHPICLEFCQSWEIPDHYTNFYGNRFVNPENPHASTHTDMALKCDCGAMVTRNGQSDLGLNRENEHADDCPLYVRHEMRADILRESYFMLTRLYILGWTAKDIGRRFGVRQRTVTRQVERRGLSNGELRDQYRTVAANTFCYLTRECEYSNQKVADIYGEDESVLRKWATDLATYDAEERGLEFVPGTENGYGWKKTRDWLPLRYQDMQGVIC